MSDDKLVRIFGEVLFDHFPDGSRVLGGAPFNVAWHLQAFGLSPHLVSRVGCDREGEQVRSAMEGWGLTTDCLQTDPQHATGRVAVTFVDGEPAYDIVADCAYDHIEPVTPSPCKLLYHGTLAARTAASADTLRQLRAGSPQTVFVDVNLRPPWWQLGAVRELLQGAHWVKLNSDELSLLGGASTSADVGCDFLQRYQLRGLLVTHGSKGAELLLAGGECLRAAPIGEIEVVDTVGAGDAFTAIILLGILNDWPMAVALQRAQEFASAVVARRGATISDRQFYRQFIRQWQLAD